jgi:hypothetical protein
MELSIFIFVISEGGFSLYSVPLVMTFVSPYLIMIAVAWRWSLEGGILLIAAGLLWLVWWSSILLPNTIPMPLSSLALVILPVSLPLLATGILFLLSSFSLRGAQGEKWKTN